MAPRTRDRLTDLALRKAKDAGWYGDGGGLYLRIDTNGAKRWIYVFQWQKKRAEMGLGSMVDVSLAEARDLRDAARKLVTAGKNPIDERKAERERKAAEAAAAAPKTFAEWAEEIAPVLAPKAEKARAAWLKMMREWVGGLKDKAPAAVATEDVLAALKPYWTSRAETGRRMRMRIEGVLDAARAKGLIAPPWENPARWNGHLEHLLSKRTTPIKHHKAMPYGAAAEFMAGLRERENMAAKALEFTVLTAARTSETLFATWAEIDLAEKVWTVPAVRMKKKREHRVPLSPAAIAVLAAVTPPEGVKPTGWVFPSMWRRGKPMSTAAMERVLDDMGLEGKATVHGMRSMFRDWAGDCTNFDKETIEAALAHLVGDETERAYRRGDALLKRRKLMEAWAGFLALKAGENVKAFTRPA